MSSYATESALPQKAVHSLIVDTGPLISNTISISTIVQSAERIYTTPAIISEIRDAATRSRVETALVPFLTLRNPSPASYEHVAAFSKKTGDFPVLSRQDMGILALAYEIEEERKREAKKDEEKDDAVKEESTKEESAVKETPSEATPSGTEPVGTAESLDGGGVSLEEGLSNLQVSSENPQDSSVKQHVSSEEQQEATQAQGESEPSDEDEDEDEDDDGGWITPHNLQKHQAKDSGVSLSDSPQPTQLSSATMTTDFAMQNVLLQMHLSLISPTLQRIQTLRTYILRCHACFLQTKDMSKQFCPRCGQPTLSRVSCTTDSKGEFKVHLSKSHQWNNRGNKYSVPKPVAGTASGKGVRGGGKSGWGTQLVLAEDQKEYLRAVEGGKRIKERDLMDDDYLPNILTGDRSGGRAGGRPKVGAPKNVNSRKRI